jgi:hypothetical protein
MFFCLDTKEPKSQGKFKSPAMVVYRTRSRYPGYDHPIRHHTESRPTKFSFAFPLSNQQSENEISYNIGVVKATLH